MPHDDAIAELLANTDAQFDLQCVNSLVSALDARGERWGAGVESNAAAERYGLVPPMTGPGSAGLGDLAPESV